MQQIRKVKLVKKENKQNIQGPGGNTCAQPGCNRKTDLKKYCFAH